MDKNLGNGQYGHYRQEINLSDLNSDEYEIDEDGLHSDSNSIGRVGISSSTGRSRTGIEQIGSISEWYRKEGLHVMSVTPPARYANNRKCSSTENYKYKSKFRSTERAKVMCFSPSFKLKFSHNTFVSTGSLLELQKRYELRGVIGQGSYGVVRVAIEILTNTVRAVKIMNKNKIRQINPKDVERIKTEVKIMKKLHHPNITRLYEVYEDEQYICLVMELCHGGHLLDKIETRTQENNETKNKFLVVCPCPECKDESSKYKEGIKEVEITNKEQLVSNIMRQIFSALQYLHNQGICHRDIKPENFLFSSRVGHEIRLVDFGLSKEFYTLNTGEYFGMTTKAGTPYFVAPEILNSTSSSYGPKCDIWSSGVLLHLLLLGVVPFPGVNDSDTISQVLNKNIYFDGSFYNRISPLAKDLLKKLLNRNVSERLDAKMALQHPWITQYNRQNTVELGCDLFPSLSINLNKSEYDRDEKKKFAFPDNNLNTLFGMSTDDLNLFPTSILKSLRSYYVSPLLKKIALTIIARYCPDKWIENLRNVFCKLDTRQIGKIKISDLRTAIQYIAARRELKLPSHHIDLLLDAVDSDGNGEIDYIEFVAAAISPKLASRKDILTLAFKMLDQDEDGYISIRDIKVLINSEKIKLFSETKLSFCNDNSIIDDLNVRIIKDENGDSMISFQGFQDIFRESYERVCKCYHNTNINDDSVLFVCGEDSMDYWYSDLLLINTENENLNQNAMPRYDEKSKINSAILNKRTGFKDFKIEITSKNAKTLKLSDDVEGTDNLVNSTEHNAKLNREIQFKGNACDRKHHGCKKAFELEKTEREKTDY
ncbi:calcium calmodulin-dependent kinase [Cryptosporidium xiaoi]|uniref:non-specific serine/threonine protein kinase n=1 Tax=Cryptosporidium xiaoi TaxID=659607 RepID=A0AAV9XZN0_9CRYT